MFTGPPLPSAPHARLHFIHDEHDAVLPADALQFLQEELRRRHIPAFPLNWLDDDARDVLGIEQPFENLPFELFEDFRAAGLCGVAVGAAISVRIRDVLDSTEQRAESLALCRFRRRQRKCAHGPAMKAAVKRDEIVALCGVSRQFDGAFYRLCTRIGEKDFLALRARHRPAQPRCQLRHTFVVKIRAGHVNQLSRLPLNCRDHFRMTMSGRAHRDTCREIEESVTVHIFHDCAVPALGYQGIVARIRRRHEFRVLLQHSLGVRPGQRGHQPGCFRFQSSWHFFLLEETKVGVH